MEYKDNLFFQSVTNGFTREEQALFFKVIVALYPATSLFNISHQLSLVLSTLKKLDSLDLPENFKSQNQGIIDLLQQVAATKRFKEKLVEERTCQGEGNPMYGHMQDYPVASLFRMPLKLLKLK